MLAIIGGSYTVVVFAHTLTQWASSLSGMGRHGSVVRNYIWVQILRLRLRRFAVDLIQLLALATILTYLLWLHRSWNVLTW